MPIRVLVVDAEIGIRIGLEDSLRVAGFDVKTADDGEMALQVASSGPFDIILLDLLLPRKDGVAVCEGLRSKGINTPVLMLSAKTQLEDKLRGFAAGADDFLTKPFEFLELLARIRAVLNRSRQSTDIGASQTHTFGNVRVNTTHGTVWRADERLVLSTKEYELLRYFVTHPAETLARDRILKEVWNSEPDGPMRTVDTHVGWLRKKIEDDPEHPRWIRTVYRRGYEFVPD